MEENAKKPIDWGKILALTALVFFALFFVEEIFGCNGHWAEFHLAGYTLTPKMVIIAILMLGYLVYLIKEKAFKKELKPLVVLVLFVLVYSLISVLIGLRSFEKSLVLSAVTSKLYVVLLLPMLAYRNNRYLTLTFLAKLFFISTFVLSVGIDALFVYCYLKGMSPTAINTFLFSIFPFSMQTIGSYPPSGVFFSSLFYVVLACLAAFVVAFYAPHPNAKKTVGWVLLSAFYAATIVQSGSRAMIFSLIVLLLVLWVIRFVKYLKQVKHATGTEEKDSLKLKAYLFAFCFAYLVLFAVAFLWKNNYFVRFFSVLSDEGVLYRFDFLQKAFGEIFSFPFFFGKGFGAAGSLVSGVHLEVDLVELWLDGGFFGLLLWLGFPTFLIIQALQLYKKHPLVSLVVIAFVVFDLAISFTNPYETNFYGDVLVGGCYLLLYAADQEKTLDRLSL